MSAEELVALLVALRVAQSDFYLLYGRVSPVEEKRMGVILKRIEFLDQRICAEHVDAARAARDWVLENAHTRKLYLEEVAKA